MLPADDRAYLAERFPGFTEAVEDGMLCVVLPDFPLPPGLQPLNADLLLRLAPGYPDVPPDMWWFHPHALRADGRAIPNTQVEESHLGRTWQRWSRHLGPNQWRVGVDSLQTYLTLVKKDLSSAAA